MTITVPPPRARTRRARRAADAASPETTARRGTRPGTVEEDAAVEAAARGAGDRERTAVTRPRRGAGEAAGRPGRAARADTPRMDGRDGERPARRGGAAGARGSGPASAEGKAARTSGGARTTTAARTAAAGTGATAPATTGRPARPAARPGAPRKTSRPAAPPRARAPFVLLVIGLLGGALVSLLLLNTVLAQDAFTLSELQQNNRQLNERKQALQEDIARESSPEVLHRKALELGMRDSQRPAFIDARTGRVTEGGARPSRVPDETVAAAAAAGVTGAPGAITPPAGGSARPEAGTEGGRR